MRILLTIALFTFGIGSTYSKGKDSLSVYPNPFADSTTIYFELEESDTITLNIYDRWGGTLASYFEKTILPQGSYSLILKGDTLKVGMYILLLQIGSSKRMTKTLIKLASVAITKEKVNQNKVFLFPNPTSDFIAIPFEGFKTILISDISGRIIRCFETDMNSVSVSDLPSGEYNVTVISDKLELISMQKMIKIRM